MKRRQIGIFGGTFDPPHIAHLAVAEAARESLNLDRVLFIPAATAPLKDRPPTPAKHRLEMARLAITGNPKFEADDCEISRGGLSYTIHTVRDLAARYPGTELRLIIGADQLESFARWRDPHDIIDIAPLVVYRRGDTQVGDVARKWNATVIRAPQLDLSSTELRRMVERQQSIRYLVPDKVRRYILENKLYQPVRFTDSVELSAG